MAITVLPLAVTSAALHNDAAPAQRLEVRNHLPRPPSHLDARLPSPDAEPTGGVAGPGRGETDDLRTDLVAVEVCYLVAGAAIGTVTPPSLARFLR